MKSEKKNKLIKYHSTLWLSCSAKSRHFFCSKTFCCKIRLVTSSRHVGTISDIFAICYGNVACSTLFLDDERVTLFLRPIDWVSEVRSCFWNGVQLLENGKSLWNWAILMTLNLWLWVLHLSNSLWERICLFFFFITVLRGEILIRSLSLSHFANEERWLYHQQQQQQYQQHQSNSIRAKTTTTTTTTTMMSKSCSFLFGRPEIESENK